MAIKQLLRPIKALGRKLVPSASSQLIHNQVWPVAERVSMSNRLPLVRIAIAGSGNFARAHLEILANIPNVQLVGICNRGNSELHALAEQYGISQTFSDYQIMLDETHPDGVFIVVSHFETVRVTTGCLQRGYPCLVEKPAGFTSKETAEMARLAEQYNCLSMVGVNRRYISSLHYGLAEILQRGPLFGITVEAPEAIRRIRNTQGHLSEEIYDRWLVGNSIHAIDLLRCLGGDVHSIVGFKNAREEVNGDSFASVMRFSHGGLGTFTAHWNSAGAWIVVLYGEGIRVNITLGNIPQGEVQLAKKRFVLPINPIDILYKPGLYAQNQAFVNALANGENLRWPASDLSDATKTMQLIEQIAMAH